MPLVPTDPAMGGMPPMPPELMGMMGGGAPPMPGGDPMMGGMPPMPGGMDPMMGGMDPMMGGAMGGVMGFPSLDPNILAQLFAPVQQLQAQDVGTFTGQQQQTAMDAFMQALGNLPNPMGYAAQTAPGEPVAPDLAAPPEELPV